MIPTTPPAIAAVEKVAPHPSPDVMGAEEGGIEEEGTRNGETLGVTITNSEDEGERVGS